MSAKILYLAPLVVFATLVGQQPASVEKPKEQPRNIEPTKASVRAELIEHMVSLKARMKASQSEVNDWTKSLGNQPNSQAREAALRMIEVHKDILLQTQRELTFALVELGKLSD